MLKTLLKSVREYRLPSLICPFVMIGEAAMEIAIPFIMQYLLKAIQAFSTPQGGDMVTVILLSLAMLSCAGVSLTCGVWGGFLGARASAGFAHNLREDMYNNLQRFSFANIDNYSTASLITRITTDVTNVQQSYQMSIRILIRAPIMFIFAIIASMLINVEVSLIFIAGALIIGVIVAFIMVKVVPYFKTMFKKYDVLNSVVQENLTAVRVVKSYVREDREIEKMQDATNQVYTYSLKAEKMLNFLNPAVQIVMYSTIIIFLLFGGNLAIQTSGGIIDATNIQALVAYATQIISGVMMVAMVLNMISLSRGSMERICQVLQEKTTLPPATNPICEVKDGSIEFIDVDFAYAQKSDDMVLQDVTLKIESGQTVGVIGATGSGKTSLVALIPRLYDCVQGAVKVGGIDVKEYELDTLRNAVAMVLQKNVLFSGSIRDNMRWGDENATDEQIWNALKQSCADEFVRALPGGLEYDLGQGGVNVSGGQKQRLCIARALLKNPKIIIFDDSTSAVDTKTDAIIRQSLKEYAPNVTKIIIAQRISSIQDSDIIVVLDDGRIESIGSHDELMRSSEIYQEVYNSQVKGDDKNG